MAAAIALSSPHEFQSNNYHNSATQFTVNSHPPRIISENRAAPLPHDSQLFAPRPMLYVSAQVNGTQVEAFVDSGSEYTVVSKTFAQHCGILELLDTSYAGLVRGLGQAKILGKVHNVPLKIGGLVLPWSCSVLDEIMWEFILGLDFLREHRCVIDLGESVLRVGTAGGFGFVRVPFLQYKDVNRYESVTTEKVAKDERKVEKPAKLGFRRKAMKLLRSFL